MTAGEGSRGPSAADQVVCGHREQRATGVWECVHPPGHERVCGHYYVRLNGAG